MCCCSSCAQEVADLCKVTTFPTYQVFIETQRVDEVVGYNPDKLRSMIVKYD